MNLLFNISIPIFLIGVYVLLNRFPCVLSNYLGEPASVVAFITALLTYIYVVLTGRMVHQMKETSEAEARPYIIPDILFEEHWGFFVIKNIGKLPAEELSVKITPDIITDIYKDGLGNTVFGKPIAFVPPGKEIKTFIVSGPDTLVEGFPKVYQVELKYKYGTKEPVTESYTIDISYQEDIIFLGTKKIEDMADSLESISKTLSLFKDSGLVVKTVEDVKQERQAAIERLKKWKEKESIDKEE